MKEWTILFAKFSSVKTRLLLRQFYFIIFESAVKLFYLMSGESRFYYSKPEIVFFCHEFLNL
jgi:hypothetical protein